MTALTSTIIRLPRTLRAGSAFSAPASMPTVLMTAVMVALFAVFSLFADNFLTSTNLNNLAVQVAPVAIAAVAMTFVISTGQIDLSVGSIVALVATVSAELLRLGMESVLVIAIALTLGATCGLINGWFAAYQGIPSFIVTLATMSIFRGIAQLHTQGYSVPIDAETIIGLLGRGTFLGVGYSAWLAAVVVAIGVIVLNRTTFGIYVNGVGSQEESVRRAGVNTTRVKLAVLMLAGIAAGLAALIIASRLGSGSANAGMGFEFTVIAAVVLGGTNLFGGRGTVLGSLVGSVITGMVANGLTLMGVSAFLIPIVTGVVLLAALWVNVRGRDLRGLVSAARARSITR